MENVKKKFRIWLYASADGWRKREYSRNDPHG